MSKHTPGPWVVIPRDESSGRSVGTIEPKPVTMETTNYWTVAEVNSLRHEWEANLRLIAATPDMLEALRKAVLALAHICESDPQDARLYGATYQAVSDAIAKATGSAS